MDDFLGRSVGKLFPGRGALLSPIPAQSQRRGPLVNRIPTAPGEIRQRRVTFPEVLRSPVGTRARKALLEKRRFFRVQ